MDTPAHSPETAGIRADDIYLPRSDVRFRTVVDEAVVLRQEAAEVLVLNEVGGRILELLDGKRRVSDIAVALSAEFDVESATAAAEVATFVAELRDAGIVSAVTPESSP